MTDLLFIYYCLSFKMELKSHINSFIYSFVHPLAHSFKGIYSAYSTFWVQDPSQGIHNKTSERGDVLSKKEIEHQ